MYVCEPVCVRERERIFVCVCQRMSMCERVRKMRKCGYVCVFQRREKVVLHVCVCVCVREREREHVSERVCQE